MNTEKNNKLNHFDDAGNAIMVDISEKNITHRIATASGDIFVSELIMKQIKDGSMKKGDVLGVARIGGIMAVKRTAQLIPLCHTILLTKCTIDFKMLEDKNIIRVLCTVTSDGKTGVEMEALTGVSVTLLSIYDMCKAVDKNMVMQNIHLVEKKGGKSGSFLFSQRKNA